jgi:hypothetical protein
MNRPWDETSNVEETREYIRKLSDKELLRYGRAARYMTTPEANAGKATAQGVSCPTGRMPSGMEAPVCSCQA